MRTGVSSLTVFCFSSVPLNDAAIYKYNLEAISCSNRRFKYAHAKINNNDRIFEWDSSHKGVAFVYYVLCLQHYAAFEKPAVSMAPFWTIMVFYLVYCGTGWLR